jgi:hypothetical protein
MGVNGLAMLREIIKDVLEEKGIGLFPKIHL